MINHAQSFGLGISYAMMLFLLIWLGMADTIEPVPDSG